MKNTLLDYKTVLVSICLFSIAGALFANILICRDSKDVILGFPLQTSKQLEMYSVSQTIIYIFIQRVKQMIILCLLFRVFAPRKLKNILIVVFSFFVGSLCACQFYQFGLLGILWLTLCLFPHYILYVWGIVAIYKYYSRKDIENNRYVFAVLALAFMVTGVFSEGIICKFFLRKFLQYMGM